MTYEHARARWLAALDTHRDAAQAYSLHLESLIRMADDDLEPGSVQGAIGRIGLQDARMLEAKGLVRQTEREMMEGLREAIAPGARESYRNALLTRLDHLCPPPREETS